MALRPRSGYWRVPILWPDGECFILGGGPSLRMEYLERLRGSRVIAVNNAYKIAPWAEVLYFGDCRWYDWHAAGVNDFAGLKVTSCEQHHDKPGVKVVKRRNGPYGIARDPHEVYWNLSSGASAVNLAAHFGARRIILLGFDMQKIEGENNWHRDHPSARDPKRDPYRRFLIPWPTIARDLKTLHIECLNACPGSALKELPIVEPESVLPPLPTTDPGPEAIFTFGFEGSTFRPAEP